MHRQITLGGAQAGFRPEEETTANECLRFDPRDPASVRAAQQALQQRFGLAAPPYLGSSEPPTTWERFKAAVFGRS